MNDKLWLLTVKGNWLTRWWHIRKFKKQWEALVTKRPLTVMQPVELSMEQNAPKDK